MSESEPTDEAEFDCLLCTMPGPQGQMNRSLLLAHCYSGSMHGVPLGSLVTNYETTEEYGRLWNMIQCYMDVSQPLPDCLLLEACRKLDSVTVEYDKKIRRKPRYWRDMSDEQYAAVIVAMQQREQI